MYGFGFGFGANARRRVTAGAAAAPVAGFSPSTQALAPSVAYHPHSQSGAVTKSGDRIVACPDRMGLAALSGYAIDGTTVVGPVEMTDALGRKFWRFRGSDVAFVANALNALNNRALTALMVGRAHNCGAFTYFSPRYSAYTDDATNTPLAAGQAGLRTNATNGPARMFNASRDSFDDATNGYKMIPGSQMQVMGLSSRTTANGATRFHHNADNAAGTQTSVSHASATGGVIGGVAAASNGFTASAKFDLYEFALWKGELTNAQADEAAAAMVANYAIPALTGQLVLEGDSITAAIATTLAVSPGSADNKAMILTAPGALLVPDTVRVLNTGVSGANVANLVTRRDQASSLYARPYPGGVINNRVAFQIGRNDWTGTTQSGTDTTAAIVALINTTTTGYLQRGWSVIAVINIATGGVIPSWTQQRSLMRATQFLTDTLSASGQAYDGLVTRIDVAAITVGGDTKFDTSGDATNTADGYYDSDGTHLTVAGETLMTSGGDTPANGYGAAW